jgi:hypothetical protein
MSGDNPSKRLCQSSRTNNGAPRTASNGQTHACPACSATFTSSHNLELHVHNRPNCAEFVTLPPLPQPQSPPVAFSSGLDVTMPPNKESTVIVSGGPFDPANEEDDYFGQAANVDDEDFGDQSNQFPSVMKPVSAPWPPAASLSHLSDMAAGQVCDSDDDELSSVEEFCDSNTILGFRVTSSMPPNWFEQHPSLAAIAATNPLCFYQGDTDFPSLETPEVPHADDVDQDSVGEVEVGQPGFAEHGIIEEAAEFEPTRPHYILPNVVSTELFTFHMTQQNKVYLELASLPIQWKCSLYAFDSLLDWCHRRCHGGNFDPGLSHPHYSTFMKHLRRTLNANQAFLVEISIEFGSFSLGDDEAIEHDRPKRTVTAIQFDFVAELTNLLSEPFAYDPNNLVLNSDPDHWFSPFLPEGDASMIDEIHSGSCYQDYVRNVWAKRPDRANCVITPIQVYLDGTHIDGRERFSLEPFSGRSLASPDIYGTSLRLGDTWVTSQASTLYSKAGKDVASQDKKCSGETAHNFHKILKVLLKPLLDVQEDGIPNFSHRIGNRIKVVTLLVPFVFVLADGLKGDKCAALKLYYTNVVRICSGCDCHYDNADNVDVKCKFLEVAPIRDLNEIALKHRDAEQRESAKQQWANNYYYQHAVDNAFFDFKYLGGGAAHSIFGALPPCFSHTVQEGVFKYVIQSFFQLVMKSICMRLTFLPWIYSVFVPARATVRSFSDALSLTASLERPN